MSIPITVLVLYLILVALVHAWQEFDGQLWAYFGRVSGAWWPERLGCDAGFRFFVLPALALQLVAIVGAFWSPLWCAGPINGWWLSVLVGACLGDAICSHFNPALKLWPNPGFGSAVLYFINALVLIVWQRAALDLEPALLAAGAFALVLPFLFLTRECDE